MDAELNSQAGTLVVDVDGTLCNIKQSGQSYSDVIPNHEMIERLREYQKKGYTILLYTARNMNTHKGNLGLINKHTAPLLLDWLSKWDVPYDEIMFGKPWPQQKGFYIDDRAIRPNEFISMDEQSIHAMLNQSHGGAV